MKNIIACVAAVLLASSVMACAAKPAKSTGKTDTVRLDFSQSIVAKRSEAAVAGARKLECPRLTGTAQIDGALDDAIWAKALTVKPLSPNSGPPTSFQLAYDADNLYVAVSCTQAPSTPIKAGVYPVNRGGPWRDDCVELFLTVEGEQEPVVYQFVVNAAGSRFGISSLEFADIDRSTYNAPWSAAVKTEGEHWTVEMAIPRESLGLKNWPSQLLFNICRNGPPPFSPQSWAGEYGRASSGTLVLQGIKPQKKAPTRMTRRGKTQDTQIYTTGEGLDLVIARTLARPGDRWIDGKIFLAPKGSIERTRVRAELYDLSSGELVASAEANPKFAEGRLSVDLRSANLPAAQLVTRLFEGGKETSVSRVVLAAKQTEEPLQPGQKIALTVDTAVETGSMKDWPVTVCVPFPAGTLWDARQVRIVNAAGKEVPSQSEVLGRWSREGSIQWLRFDTRVSSGERYFAEFTPSSAAIPDALKVTKEGDSRVELDTGAARYVIAKGSSPIREIWVGKQKVASSVDARGLYVIDQKGQLASASPDDETLEVEASGPQAACVRLEGWYKTKSGEQLARHITRIEAFAGQPFAKVTHTLVLCRDSNEVWFKDIGWEFSVAPGSSPRAIFGVERDKPSESVTQSLGGAVKSAYMIQDGHFLFRTNVNHYAVASVDAAGKSTTVREGKECGDWAALAGDSAALMAACRETARQHPKEFEVTGDKLVLRLFSNRAGDELDFRTPALVKLWNLKEWLNVAELVLVNWQGQTAEKSYEDILKLPSNGLGWAKTHELMFAPLPPAEAAVAAPKFAGTLTFPVYVNVDPRWIYQTDALGPLHPRDPQRFPEAEETLQRTFEEYRRRETDMGLYGFFYFEEGPICFLARGDDRWADIVRWFVRYNLRRDFLFLAARSGDRAIRAAAEATNRRAVDNRFAHWNGPGRTLGGWRQAHGGDNLLATHAALPYLWEGNTYFDTGGSCEPENIVNLHYLTGDRRAREVANNYFRALKASWTPREVRNQFFVHRYLTLFTQGYAFTEDPELGELARATLDMLYDPETALLANQYTYSASYKVMQDIHGLIHGAWLMGEPKFQEYASVRARYLEDNTLSEVVRYQSNQGMVSSFLYREAREPYVAENAALFLRQLGTLYDPVQKRLIDTRGLVRNGARVGPLMNGLAFSQDIVVRSGADLKPVASWAGASFYDDIRTEKPGTAGSIIMDKASNRPLDLRYYGSALASRGEVRLKRLEGKEGDWGTDLNSLWTWMDSGTARVSIEKLAPPGAYEVTGGQLAFVIANERRPMVVYAPGDWTPYPDQRPFPSIYFKVPGDAKDAAIVFEGTARLFDPDGKPYPDEKPVTGEVKLPATRVGLWSFQPVENKKVRVVNLPPFFAFRDPAFYFEPTLPTTPK